METDQLISDEASEVLPVAAVPKLFESAALVTALHYSCEQLESHQAQIDEGMLKRVAFWAFPQDENHVRAFVRLNLKRDTEWGRGVRLVEDGLVQEVNQVGFMLTASIKRRYQDGTLKEETKVSVTFEKRQITSSNCALCSSVWCLHIIAVIVYRIRYARKVQLFAPLTETLSTFTKEQLQKLLQYAITSDPGAILGKVFTHFDSLRDLSSKENILPGAPDPTFGPDPGTKSQLEATLQEMERKLKGDFKSGYESYPATYSIDEKQESGMYRVYVSRVFDLIDQGEIDAAARVLIIMTKTTFETMDEKVNPPSRVKWFFHDLERLWSMFFISFPGHMTEELSSTVLYVNREANKMPLLKFLRRSDWGECPSLKDAVVEDLVSMEAVRTAPFYDPLIASLLPNSNSEVNDILTGNVSPLVSTFYEPISVMLLRFDALLMRTGSEFTLQARRIGIVILKELMELSMQYSILSRDKQSESMDWSSNLPVTDYSRNKLEGPKKVRRRRKHYVYAKKKHTRKSVKEEPVVVEPVIKQDLPLEQVAYCLLYTCQRMYKTQKVQRLDKEVLDLLLHSSFRALELSRFRTLGRVFCDSTEQKWLHQLETDLDGYCVRNVSEKIAGMYIAAIMKHGFAFYDNTPPLVLIHTLCKCSSMDFPQTLDLCVTTLCNSADPMLKYSSVTNVDGLMDQFVGIFRFVLDVVHCCQKENQCRHLTQILYHLELIHDGDLMCRLMPVFKNLQDKSLNMEQIQSLTSIVVKFIKNSADRTYGWDCSKTLTETLLGYLVWLGKFQVLHFLKIALSSWQEIGMYLGMNKLKKLVNNLHLHIWDNRGSCTQSSVVITMIVDYLQSNIKHGLESCALLGLFKQGGQNTIAIRVIRKNAHNYSFDALLKTAEIVHRNKDHDRLSLDLFSKEVFDLIKSALPKVGNRGVVQTSEGMGLEYDLNSHLKWVFKCLKEDVSSEVVNTEQYKTFMQILSDSFLENAGVLLRFFQYIEDSNRHLQTCKVLLGPGLVKAYEVLISKSLQHSSRSSYWTVFREMENAYHNCVKYVINGKSAFINDILLPVRRNNKGKKKFLKLIEENFLFGPLIN
ncbi:hypothetical protein ScPMuIL_001991 [Solemya velum]